MTIIDSPCKNCKDRYLGCHSKYEKYIEYKNKKITQGRELRNNKINAYNIDSYFKTKIEKEKNRKR